MRPFALAPTIFILLCSALLTACQSAVRTVPVISAADSASAAPDQPVTQKSTTSSFASQRTPKVYIDANGCKINADASDAVADCPSGKNTAPSLLKFFNY